MQKSKASTFNWNKFLIQLDYKRLVNKNKSVLKNRGVSPDIFQVDF